MSDKETQHSKSSLEITDLCFHYVASEPVIAWYSLKVNAGEVHCVLGHSGGGKTSLLRLIAGLEHVVAGSICIGGTEVSGKTTHLLPEHRPVGMVFQDFALFPNRSVLGNVTFGLNDLPRSERKAGAEELLARVGIQDLAKRMPHTLSGGQQQRVAIARSLARKPKVMLLDEPFSSLDTATREEIRTETLELLRSAGVATLMVTHDPEEAREVADEISWLNSNNSREEHAS